MGFAMACALAGGEDPAGAVDVAPAAPPPAAAPEASIPFANHGGIYDWRAVDDRTLLIESVQHKWYKATLFTPCVDLAFAERVGFESNPDGSFDKFSAIQVGSQRCPLISLTPTAAPVKKPKDKKPAAAAPAHPPAPPPAPAPAPANGASHP
jgi:hypothetical protein